MIGKELVWTTFYMEFADKLLTYKNDRGSLIEIIKKVYDTIGLKLPKLESGELLDIDPFTVYGLFNKGISDQNRTAILRGFSSEWNLQSEVPEVFPGVPVVNNMAATFYAFQEDVHRKPDDIDNLWEVFDAAIELAEDDYSGSAKRFEDAYNKAIKQYAIKWNLTMGLYWIRPYCYLNLDSRNRWFIVDWKGMPDRFVEKIKDLIKNVPNGEDYLFICNECLSTLELGELRYKTIPELSKYAWDESERVNKKEKMWSPSLDEYDPGLTKEDWLKLLNDTEIIGPVWGGALAAFYEAGGQATCAQIGQRYGKDPSSISGNCTQLAIRIAKETNCPLFEEGGNKEYWPIMFQMKKAGADIPGTWLWKLRPELMEALSDFDIMKYQWSIVDEAPPRADVNYWWMLCNPKIWDFSAVDVGFEQDYTLYNSNGHKRRIFQNFLDAKEGDIIFGYMSTPIKKLVGLGVVTKAQDGERILFKKTEDFENPIDYSELKDAPDLKTAEFMGGAQGSLFKVKPEEAEYLLDIIAEANPAPVVKEAEKYSSEKFLNEVFMGAKDYAKLKKLLERKKNVILQGAPGVGKTHSAKRLAYSIMGQKDEDRIKIIQFHQNYSYEDFIMGYRPDGDTFTLTTGVFYDFCKKAARDPERDYFFIIDEINRGNLSKIFGELLMLIEADHRTDKVQLAYRQEQFSVPDNLYIIGMMNTADRSLALIDYALRRRFSFFTMKPDYQLPSFQKYQEQVNNSHFNALIKTVEDLNRAIEDDSALGAGFCIGYSYFCDEKEVIDDDWINSVVEYDLIPTLEEYWFDDQTKVDNWSEKLRNVTK